MNRIKEKISEVEQFLDELCSVLPTNLDEYKADFKIRSICERHFEKIIEAVIDITFLVITKRELAFPEEDKKAFDVLGAAKIISPDLAQKLKEAKGMRNILAHNYGKVNDNLVFEAVTERLNNDIRLFIESMKKL